jgi:tetratricopeptide (TPR) repeat protein
MKRTQRNLALILTAIAILWLVLRQFPLLTAMWVCGGLLALGVLVALLGIGFVIGRYRMRKKQWDRALERFRAFEQRLLLRRWTVILRPLFVGIYTFDGVALARNDIATCLMHLGKGDEAVQWLRAALQRDPLYAIPYINLAMVAAARDDETSMRRDLRRAVDLGYSPAGAQQILTRLLARSGSSLARILEP